MHSEKDALVYWKEEELMLGQPVRSISEVIERSGCTKKEGAAIFRRKESWSCDLVREKREKRRRISTTYLD